MRLIKRRAFLLGAGAAASLAACAPTRLAHSRRGVAVRAGQDRFGSGRTVFGALHLDAKVSAQDTDGGLFILEHADDAKGGPPRHLHHAQDEWFYVLEGAYVLDVGDERFELGPGDSVLAPRGIPHVFAFTGEGRGRILIAFQPAGQMEAFFAALAQAGAAPAPEALRSLFSAHGMALVGPPLPV